MTLDLDYGQQTAVNDVTRWFVDPASPQVYRLFGYAGTGKTTLAKHIADTLGIPALYAAYSGKAASVLRSKGCAGASTIHSLIYKPAAKSRQELEELQREYDEQPTAELRQCIADLRAELAVPAFHLNPDSALRGAPLLILDEVSMVSQDIARDLESFGTRILCLGDPAQLPPVDGGGYYTETMPDMLLTSIHRSAANSPVTRLATAARQSDDPLHGVPSMDGDSGRSRKPVRLSDFDQVLVWKNKTRWEMIDRMRKLAGNAGLPPQPGERIITLANNPDADVRNGEQFTVLTITEAGEVYRMLVSDDMGSERELVAQRIGFTGPEGESASRRIGFRGAASATYAHAITVHKAQGSQWGSVLVIDESSGLEWVTAKVAREGGATRKEAQAQGAKQARRWFYTALTRAAVRVVIR